MEIVLPFVPVNFESRVAGAETEWRVIGPQARYTRCEPKARAIHERERESGGECVSKNTHAPVACVSPEEKFKKFTLPVKLVSL